MSLVERLRFKLYMVDEVLNNGGLIEQTPYLERIDLNVNPKEIRWEKPRIVEKTYTQRPGRFIYSDWGLDVPKLEISGQTGNLLPDDMDLNQKKRLIDMVKSAIGAQEAFAGPGVYVPPAGADLESMAVGQLIEYLPYSQILSLSDKYKAFKDLEGIYTTFDANRQIMILIIGMEWHRGIMTNFGFTQTIESPWNWAYSMTFEIIEPRMYKSSDVWAVGIERTDKGRAQEHWTPFTVKG